MTDVEMENLKLRQEVERLKLALETAEYQARHWQVKAEEYRFDNRGDW